MPPRVAAGLRRHACAALPAECCGALLGRRTPSRIDVSTLIPLDNAAVSPSQYRIEAHAVMQLELQAARAGLEVIGFYHSHPEGPARPSRTDLELACPGYVHVIVQAGAVPCAEPPAGVSAAPAYTLADTVRAWRLAADRSCFVELPIVQRGPRSRPAYDAGLPGDQRAGVS